jgi:rhamnosyltransferase
LRGFATAHPQTVSLIENTHNLGLGAAQNQAIRQAVAAGFEWVLLLDHDSIPQRGMVETMLAARATHEQEKIGIVVPNIIEKASAEPYGFLVQSGPFGTARLQLKQGESRSDVLVAIASGSMVHTDVFQHIGLINEAWFIDYLDYDFCLRAKNGGWKILAIQQAVLLHSLGAKIIHNLGMFRVVTSNHRPSRRYTIFRNRMYVIRRYGFTYPGVALHELMAYGYDLARILLLEKNGFAKLKAALKGIFHGTFNKIPRPPYL